MKKIKKLNLSERLLDPEEIKLLKGGDVENKNGLHGCTCTYYDGPSVTNTNTYFGCSCVCVY